MIEFVRTKRDGGSPPPSVGERVEREAGTPRPDARQGTLSRPVRKARRRLRDVQVHFLSLVPAAANQRTVLVKNAEGTGRTILEKELGIARTDARRRIVYGIVYAPDEVDTDGDTVEAAEIEKAAYEFMRVGRTGQIDSDHDGVPGKGFVAESWIVRPADPLFVAETPGAWAVGIKVTDADTWQRLEKGKLRGISMAGLARPETITEANAPDTQWRVDDESSGGIITKIRKIIGLDGAPEECFDGPPLSALVKADVRRDATLLDLTARTQDLTVRLETLERQTAGRQTLLGGNPASLRKNERSRGLQIL